MTHVRVNKPTRVVYAGQILDLAAGDEHRHEVGAFLASAGVDVEVLAEDDPPPPDPAPEQEPPVITDPAPPAGGDDPNPTGAGGEAVPQGAAAEVLGWVDADPDQVPARAGQALALEVAKSRPRAGLVDELKKRAAL